jgi:hypothetical protein
VELGGRALAPPFDTPMTRMAVLTDPGGAAFSIANVPGSARCLIIPSVVHADAAIAPDLSHPVVDVVRRRAAGRVGPGRAP